MLLAFGANIGSNAKNSITQLRNTLNSLVDFPVGVEDNIAATQIPQGYVLGQNYPNPFNPSTTIEYTLPQRSKVAIDIYNVLGQKVRTLVDETQAAGSHSIVWDGTNQSGQSVSTGFYFYKLTAGDYIDSRKMLMIK